MTIGDAIYDHFVRFFREPVVAETFGLPHRSHAIQILGFDRVYSRCRVHASFGLSHYASEIGQVAEVYVPAEGHAEGLPELLAASLFRLVENGRTIRRGEAIPFADVLPDFAAKTSKSALYLTHPFGLPQEFSNVPMGAHLYVGMLIAPAEQRLLEADGVAAFEQRLERAGVDPFDLARPSMI